MADNTTRSEATQSFFVYVRDRTTNTIRRVAIPSDLQIGLEGAPSELHLTGRLSVAAKTYTANSSNKGIIGVDNNDTVVAVATAVAPLSGRITLNLPTTPREGQLHFIKDSDGAAASTPIDVIPPSGTSIDDQSFLTISDDYGSIALIWLGGSWQTLVAGAGSSGGGGVSSTLSFVTINAEPSLSNERRLVGSSNIPMTDLGANSTVSFDLSSILGVGAGTFTYATLTVDAYGRVTAASNGVSPPSPNASYLTAQAEPGLPQRRVMSGGLGTTVTDYGAGTNFSFNVDPTIIPFLSAANVFTNPNTFNAGITGSITQLPSGAGSYIIGLGSVNVTSNSLGQIIISGSGAGGSGGSTIVTGSSGARVTSVGSTYTVFVDPLVIPYLSGNNTFTSGLTGSIQQLPGGAGPYITGIGGVVVTTGSNGQIIVSGSSGGGSSASALPLINNICIIAGRESVNRSVFEAVSAFEFNPSGPETMAPSGSTAYSAYFQPIIEVFPTGTTCETQLFNVTTQTYIAASLLSSSFLATTRLRSSDLSSFLATGSNIYEMHMRITNAGAGTALCKGAKLFVTWR